MWCHVVLPYVFKAAESRFLLLRVLNGKIFPDALVHGVFQFGEDSVCVVIGWCDKNFYHGCRSTSIPYFLLKKALSKLMFPLVS